MPDNIATGQSVIRSPRLGDVDSEFILLVAPAWQDRLPVVLALLEEAGAEVISVHQRCAVIEGRVGANRLQALWRLAPVASLGWRRMGNNDCQLDE